MLSEIDTRLNRVIEHPFDGTLLRYTREKLLPGQCLSFYIEFIVILLNLLKYEGSNSFVNHVVRPLLSDR